MTDKPGFAVLDTDVFSLVYVDPQRAIRRGYDTSTWEARLEGVQVLISFQTRAEVLAGLRLSNWGEVRLAEARRKLDSAPTIGVDRAVIDAYADVTAASRRVRHGLRDPVHAADRWVAACAIAKDLPLLSNDSIFLGAPGLRLLA